MTMTPTQQAHEDLRKILLTGRILINGLPLTGNELGVIIQGEQMLFEKASRLDAAAALTAKQKAESAKKAGKPKIIPLKQPNKKE